MVFEFTKQIDYVVKEDIAQAKHFLLLKQIPF